MIERTRYLNRLSESVRFDLESQPDHLWVIYPGSRRYPVDERITVLPLEAFLASRGV